MGRRRDCPTHRVALLDFVDRRETGAGTSAALDHLDRCRSCEVELSAILLAIHALRRLLGEARAADPPGDAWDQLRSRVQRPAAGAWQARTALAGVVVGASLAAALVAPSTVFPSRAAVEREPGPAPDVLRARTAADQAAEAAFLMRMRIDRAVPAAPIQVVYADAKWSGPDGLGRAEPTSALVAPPDRAD